MDECPVLDEIRDLLAEPITDTERVTRIGALLQPEPEPEPRPVPKDSRGWIIFTGGAVIDLPDEGEPYDPRD